MGIVNVTGCHYPPAYPNEARGSVATKRGNTVSVPRPISILSIEVIKKSTSLQDTDLSYLHDSITLFQAKGLLC